MSFYSSVQFDYVDSSVGTLYGAIQEYMDAQTGSLIDQWLEDLDLEKPRKTYTERVLPFVHVLIWILFFFLPLFCLFKGIS